MDWIKKNPAQLTLALVAAVAIAVTVLLYMKVSAFDSTFDDVRGAVMSNASVEKLDMASIDKASKAVGTPVTWTLSGKDAPKLFVSKLYVLHDGKLEQAGGKMFHPPVPNDWLEKYGFDFLNAAVLKADPDGDGFTNLEEWNGLDAISHLDNAGQPVMGADGKPLPADSTDPTDPKSHPPYHTKLELAKVVNIPFRLRVMSIDVPAKINKPSDVTVQINTIDRGNKTRFLPVGDDIPGTNYKIDSYQHKEAPGADGTVNDVSEITIINKETGAKVILPLKQVVDSPDSHAVFRYKWKLPTGPKTDDFAKRLNETFNLQPEIDKVYKLIEIKGQEVTIELPDGTKKTLTATQ